MTGHSRRSFCNGNFCSRYNFTYNDDFELVSTKCDYIKMVAISFREIKISLSMVDSIN